MNNLTFFFQCKIILKKHLLNRFEADLQWHEVNRLSLLEISSSHLIDLLGKKKEKEKQHVTGLKFHPVLSNV
jgi:hypothetical protein